MRGACCWSILGAKYFNNMPSTSSSYTKKPDENSWLSFKIKTKKTIEQDKQCEKETNLTFSLLIPSFANLLCHK